MTLHLCHRKRSFVHRLQQNIYSTWAKLDLNNSLFEYYAVMFMTSKPTTRSERLHIDWVIAVQTIIRYPPMSLVHFQCYYRQYISIVTVFASKDTSVIILSRLVSNIFFNVHFVLLNNTDDAANELVQIVCWLVVRVRIVHFKFIFIYIHLHKSCHYP